MSRKWLIVVSVATHVSLAAVLVITGLWRIDRVEAAAYLRHFDLTQPGSKAAASGPATAQTVTFKPKHIAHDTHQPATLRPPDQTPPTGEVGTGGTGLGAGSGSGQVGGGTCTENCVEAAVPADPVCGNGSLESGEECDDGNTTSGDGCSATCRREPKPVPMLPPAVLQGLRISGETQIHPDDVTQNRMRRDGVGRAVGTLLVCVSTAGGVSSARMVGSTKYPEYDATLLSAVRDWQYRPYAANGVAIPVCGTVTFVYTVR
jgi:TonB family protein